MDTSPFTFNIDDQSMSGSASVSFGAFSKSRIKRAAEIGIRKSQHPAMGSDEPVLVTVEGAVAHEVL